ncbi:hypothetical protein CRUP_018890 [Coryphaenoides rupestris]|nr:hypothetical protein CRUP_018890 [Coryphaenoides rupestris]
MVLCSRTELGCKALLGIRNDETEMYWTVNGNGKLYDAYVSYLYSSSGGGSSQVVTFALTVLPEVLEKRHGFRLFIQGRDDCPGEALHDAIAGAISRSRRLVLLLSAQTQAQTLSVSAASPLHASQSQLAYEHSIGLRPGRLHGATRVPPLYPENTGGAEVARGLTWQLYVHQVNLITS